ncbi:MAG: adenylate/guanylate cyclase domain-containing protein [Acidimicrobiales bacterium]|jgi:adenylate cyclase|nr:adenylate/guanylate cyclase domain-containing protein [Acidimicrobiales bacterium]
MSAPAEPPRHDDDLAAAGLYEPGADDAAEQVALVRRLLDGGVPLDTLVESAASGRMGSRLAERVVGRWQPLLTLDEVAELAGLPVERARLVWRASGFPDPAPDARPFWPSDAEVFRAFDLGAHLFGDDATAQFARVIGRAAARIAEAALAIYFESTVSEDGPRGHGVVEQARTAEGAAAAFDLLPVAVEGLLRHHFGEAVRRAAESGLSDGGVPVQCIGFLDLVESTRLARRLTPDELAAISSEFETTSADLVSAHGGRVVKFLGDGVMYVVTDPGAACEIALTIRDAVRAHPTLTSIRGGLCFGTVRWQAGDYYGPVVALASRLEDLAEPDTVLVPGLLALDLEARGFAVRAAGRRAIRGFDEPIELVAVDWPPSGRPPAAPSAP